MLARISRYHDLADTVGEDLRGSGRTVVTKSLRLLPQAGAQVEHTVADGDRLDRLAFTYYGQPRKWWRICDANPDFVSPLELVGGGPLRTLRIALAVRDAGAPPWAALATTLAAEPRVVGFRFVDEPRAHEDAAADLATLVTYNRLALRDGQALNERELLELISDAGFAASAPQVVGRAGARIAVPPDTAR